MLDGLDMTGEAASAATGQAADRLTAAVGWTVLVALAVTVGAMAMKLAGHPPPGIDGLLWLTQLQSVVSRLVRTIVTLDSKFWAVLLSWLLCLVMAMMGTGSRYSGSSRRILVDPIVAVVRKAGEQRSRAVDARLVTI